MACYTSGYDGFGHMGVQHMVYSSPGYGSFTTTASLAAEKYGAGGLPWELHKVNTYDSNTHKVFDKMRSPSYGYGHGGVVQGGGYCSPTSVSSSHFTHGSTISGWQQVEWGQTAAQGHACRMFEEIPMLQGRVLSVNFHHMTQPVAMEVFYRAFSSYGMVEKIVPTAHMLGSQVLVQYQTCQMAIQALGALHGRYLPEACCQVEIQYAQESELQILYASTSALNSQSTSNSYCVNHTATMPREDNYHRVKRAPQVANMMLNSEVVEAETIVQQGQSSVGTKEVQELLNQTIAKLDAMIESSKKWTQEMQRKREQEEFKKELEHFFRHAFDLFDEMPKSDAELRSDNGSVTSNLDHSLEDNSEYLNETLVKDDDIYLDPFFSDAFNLFDEVTQVKMEENAQIGQQETQGGISLCFDPIGKCLKWAQKSMCVQADRKSVDNSVVLEFSESEKGLFYTVGLPSCCGKTVIEKLFQGAINQSLEGLSCLVAVLPNKLQSWGLSPLLQQCINNARPSLPWDPGDQEYEKGSRKLVGSLLLINKLNHLEHEVIVVFTTANGDTKLKETMEVMKLSVNWQFLSIEEFKGSGSLTGRCLQFGCWEELTLVLPQFSLSLCCTTLLSTIDAVNLTRGYHYQLQPARNHCLAPPPAKPPDICDLMFKCARFTLRRAKDLSQDSYFSFFVNCIYKVIANFSLEAKGISYALIKAEEILKCYCLVAKKECISTAAISIASVRIFGAVLGTIPSTSHVIVKLLYHLRTYISWLAINHDSPAHSSTQCLIGNQSSRADPLLHGIMDLHILNGPCRAITESLYACQGGIFDHYYSNVALCTLIKEHCNLVGIWSHGILSTQARIGRVTADSILTCQEDIRETHYGLNILDWFNICVAVQSFTSLCTMNWKGAAACIV